MKLTLLSLFAILLTPAAFAEYPDSVAPLRLAKVQVKVNKTHLAYSDLFEKEETLFEGRAEWPVYDYRREAKEYRQEGIFPLISTTVRGKPIKVQVSGVIEYLAATASAPAKKSVRGSLFMTYPNGDIHAMQPFYTGTTDLNARNFDLFISSATFDFPGLPRGTEALRVWLTVDDVNQ
ncbi:MAG: hypothetical protein EOP11_24865 [Proteobacteria bacterium]|nr:MAG: hypothetical protein EOP11_24865 [Pseudomonadota bacterium]